MNPTWYNFKSSLNYIHVLQAVLQSVDTAETIESTQLQIWYPNKPQPIVEKKTASPVHI